MLKVNYLTTYKAIRYYCSRSQSNTLSLRLPACRARVHCTGGRSSSNQINSARPELLPCTQSATATPSCSPNQRRWDGLCRCPSASRENQPARSRNISLFSALLEPKKWQIWSLCRMRWLVGCKQWCAYSCKQRQSTRTIHRKSNLRDYSPINNFLKWESPTKRLNTIALQNSIIWDTMY